MDDDVYQEFQRDLARWQQRFAGRPQDEMSHLLLLALEREQIVSTAYREAALATRLEHMPLPDDVRSVLQHALIWIWRDEDMHATYVRGALLRWGRWPLRLRALTEQMSGAVAGWATSVQHHLAWWKAPASRLLAASFVALGWVIGRVPAAVLKHLRHCSFSDFCRFNIEAENTAALCWERMVVLANQVRPALAVDFDRMRSDEVRHAQVFEVLTQAFDSKDRPTLAAADLVQRIRPIGEYFVPRFSRTDDHPIGRGGPVHVVTGASAADKLTAFNRLLQDSGLSDVLHARRQMVGRPLRVIVKPTFMMAYHHEDPAVTTDPALVDALAGWLQAAGCAEVAVAEAPNLYDRWYAHRSVRAVAQYSGFSSLQYRLVDLAQDRIPHRYHRGLGQETISRAWAEADFRMVFGKLRSHPVEQVALGLSTMEGVGTPYHDLIFLERPANHNTATVMVLDDFPPHFALLDGYDSAPDTLMGLIACPDPRTPHRLYAGQDALAVDLVAARHLGLKHWSRAPLLRAACHWFGDPGERVPVIGTDTPIQDWRGPYANEWTSLLSLLAHPVYVLASSRGAVFVPDMDEVAFPPLHAESAVLRWRRRTLRRLLGFRRPPRTI